MVSNAGMKVTRGGLSPASITNLKNSSEVVYFMFNPFEFTIERNISWFPEGGAGQNLPVQVFDKGNAPTVSLTLHFDSMDTKKDVRDFTQMLWKMTMVDEASINQTTKKGQPPAVAFQWGRLYFKAVITRIAEKFTLFDENGTPLRCEVTLSLTLYEGLNTYQSQGGGQLRQATQEEQNRPREMILVQGQRLDHVAGQDGGQPSNYRDVAAQNNINNPQRVPPGTKISKPST